MVIVEVTCHNAEKLREREREMVIEPVREEGYKYMSELFRTMISVA